MSAADTITAIATPPGRGGIGIVRVSGPATAAIATAMLGRVPAPRQAEFHRFLAADGEAIDAGIALFFPAPHSFTGEDVLELQAHGSPVVLDMLLERLFALGARHARPGEFSERAFLNERLDLAQAEAIADLIDSASREAARSAMRSLQGEFSQRVQSLLAQLTGLRVHVEAAIDFPDEEIDFLSDSAIRQRFADLLAAFETLMSEVRQGCLLREGIRVVIAGRPNAGKSSLLNRLAQRETAIVTEIPGTTRDVLREHIVIDGLPLHVIDTAGLRDSDDPVEQIGIARARAEMDQAERILLVVDATAGASDPMAAAGLPPGFADRLTVVYNKIDLSDERPGVNEAGQGMATIRLSARTGAGIDLLRQHLKSCCGFAGPESGLFTARGRHIDALRRADAAVRGALGILEQQGALELAAEDLRQAQQAIGEITGEVTSDDLLGEIFSSFCIGK